MQTLSLVLQLMDTVLAKVVLSSGIFLCFLTCWSLTLLVSAIIGSVVCFSSVCARPSKKLNMKSLAKGAATEAVGNILTMRSAAMALNLRCRCLATLRKKETCPRAEQWES